MLELLNTQKQGNKKFIKKFSDHIGSSSNNAFDMFGWLLPTTIDARNKFSAEDIRKLCPK